MERLNHVVGIFQKNDETDLWLYVRGDVPHHIEEERYAFRTQFHKPIQTQFLKP